MDIFPIALLILALYGKNNKIKENLNSEYLSKESGNALKGLFALLVILHHLAQRTNDGLMFRLYDLMGYLAVAVFFFLSGYGLQKQYLINKNYQKGFLPKKIGTVLIPYILITIPYWLLYNAQGTTYTLKDIFLLFRQGETIVKFSWYIITIFLFYVAFWALMNICKNRHNLMIIGAAIYFALYVIICRKLGYDSYWYKTTHLLIIGMIWATYEDEIITIIKKKHRLLSMIINILFLFLFCFKGSLSKAIKISEISTILESITATFFVLSIVLFSSKRKIGNPILNYLGKISMEIYLIHGLFILQLRSQVLYIYNDFLYAMFVMVGSIVFAQLFHYANTWIFGKYNKAFQI